MTPEKFMPFPGQKKIEEEAHEINKKVDDFYDRPRTNKSRSKDETAHEMIKSKQDSPLNLGELSEEERQWYKNISANGIRFVHDGFVEISRWDEKIKEGENRQRQWQKVDGINSAIRMQDHILDRYRVDKDPKASEFSHLESIQEVIEKANELMLEWKNAKPEEKKDLQQKMAWVVLQLERCRNEFKVETKDQSAAIVKMKDRLERDNPSALAARTVAALNRLTSRMNEMQLIMPVMAMRRETLVLEKRRIASTLRKAVGQLVGIMHHQVFDTKSKNPADERINDNEVAILDRKIGKALYLLSTIRVLPYSQQAEQARFSLMHETKGFFSSKKKLIDNIDNIKEGLVKAASILESNIEHLG